LKAILTTSEFSATTRHLGDNFDWRRVRIPSGTIFATKILSSIIIDLIK